MIFKVKNLILNKMNSKLEQISEYTDNQLREYFENEDLQFLHVMKTNLDDIYYNTGETSKLSDHQYDILKESIQSRDPNYIPPIGAVLREGENRVRLPYWLGSMDKIKPNDVREFERWIESYGCSEYVIEEKLDGVSCLMVVKDGEINLYTRGNGKIGADISYMSRYLRNIPKTISEDIVVRGELILEERVFKRKYKEDYANPRNMVSGILGSKKIRKGLSDINFIAYEIINTENNIKPIRQFEYLTNLGFCVVRYELVKNITIETLLELLLKIKGESRYEIDGLIVQGNREYVRNDSGNPKYAFAFKTQFGESLLETEVIEVEWNVSKWGILKPRVQIDPVYIGGVCITYATGFNAKYISDNKIGPGTVIKITRSGDVIPYITEVIRGTVAQMPESNYTWNESGVEILTNIDNDMIQIKTISSFFSSLGIKHVSEATVRKLYNNGYDNLFKILSASVEDLLKIDTFKQKMAERTYNNIHEGLQGVTVPLVLGASSVFGFGMGVRKIKSLFEGYPEILNDYKNLSREELKERVMQIEGYSEKTADKIVDNIRYADKFIEKISLYASFRENIVNNEDPAILTLPSNASSPPLVSGASKKSLEGMKIVFSGFRDKNLEEDIMSKGGKVSSSVSSKTNILIVINKEERSTKIVKAMELGVKISNKEEFISEYI